MQARVVWHIMGNTSWAQNFWTKCSDYCFNISEFSFSSFNLTQKKIIALLYYYYNLCSFDYLLVYFYQILYANICNMSNHDMTTWEFPASLLRWAKFILGMFKAMAFQLQTLMLHWLLKHVHPSFDRKSSSNVTEILHFPWTNFIVMFSTFLTKNDLRKSESDFWPRRC